jgi:ribosomal-protein-alanine N-acetyltransferase
MLKGKQITVRPMRNEDIGPFHEKSLDVESRGPWYPLPGTSLAAFEKAFAESGFWTPERGIFVITDDTDRVIGNISWQQLNGDVSDIELGYRLLSPADSGKGIVSEALGLMTDWLFDTQPQTNGLSLTIHVDNLASLRVAEKCGFIREATFREAWYNRGRWHDVAICNITRHEFEARRESSARQGADAANLKAVG